mmetsp:Transcript_4247/g.15266  ORF Transcript_4247/g.15266 Transcript_4247/m.15266 type:complete len:154 (-) Transcript_4247:40-501(-)
MTSPVTTLKIGEIVPESLSICSSSCRQTNIGFGLCMQRTKDLYRFHLSYRFQKRKCGLPHLLMSEIPHDLDNRAPPCQCGSSLRAESMGSTNHPCDHQTAVLYQRCLPAYEPSCSLQRRPRWLESAVLQPQTAAKLQDCQASIGSTSALVETA